MKVDRKPNQTMRALVDAQRPKDCKNASCATMARTFVRQASGDYGSCACGRIWELRVREKA